MDREDYLKLCKDIEELDYQYYVLNDPSVSDYEYDRLLKKLETIEKENPSWKVSWSPTMRIGDRVSREFPTVIHDSPMLSIANTYSKEELEDFFQRTEKALGCSPSYVAELKIDGIAASLRYEKGIFVLGVSRGDGRQGEDITANIRTIRSLPMYVKDSNFSKGTFEVRGEVFLPRKTFEEINRRQRLENKPIFANPRNTAGGSLKLHSPLEASKRGLCFSVYEVFCRDGVEEENSQYSLLMKCRELGFSVDTSPKRCFSKSDVLEYIQQVREKRDSLPMDIDGVVIKVDDLKFRELLGMTGKHYRWAVAYKFAAQQAESIVREIVVQVGRTGVLTPVACLDPVFLSGSTVSRATLHNEDEISRKDIRIGDTVLIEKGGDVIPKIIEVVLSKRGKESKPWQMPRECPICETPVERKEGEVSVRCPNILCLGSELGKICYFTSKKGLDITHLGEKVVKKLVHHGLLKKRSDIFRLTYESLSMVPGFKRKSVENLLASIENAKKVPLSNFIVSLGIPFVGERTARLLVFRYRSLENFLKVSKEDLLKIEGIGDKVADAIATYLGSPSDVEEIQELLQLGVEVKPFCGGDRVSKESPFFKKSVVITGTLSSYSRKEAEEVVISRGGKVSSSVSSSTGFVVVGESPGSKYEKAKALGVPILDEETFKEMLSY